MHLVKLLLLLLQVGDNLSEMVLVHLQVVQLLLQAVLGLFQFVIGQVPLIHALTRGLQVTLQTLLHFLRVLQRARLLLHFLSQFTQLEIEITTLNLNKQSNGTGCNHETVISFKYSFSIQKPRVFAPSLSVRTRDYIYIGVCCIGQCVMFG